MEKGQRGQVWQHKHVANSFSSPFQLYLHTLALCQQNRKYKTEESHRGYGRFPQGKFTYPEKSSPTALPSIGQSVHLLDLPPSMQGRDFGWMGL